MLFFWLADDSQGTQAFSDLMCSRRDGSLPHGFRHRAKSSLEPETSFVHGLYGYYWSAVEIGPTTVRNGTA